MNTAIVFKWGYDPDDAYITSDGSFRWKRGQLVASDDDAAAVASARKVAEQTNGTLIGVTIGNGDASWAAARGAERAISVSDFMPEPNDVLVAETLATALKHAGAVDIVAIADAIDTAGVAPVLAEKLGMSCVLDVRDFQVDPENPGKLLAHRAEGNTIETIRFSTPAVVAVSAEKSEENVPSMKEMLAARKAPCDVVVVESVSANDTKTESIKRAELRQAKLFEGSAQEAADQLVAALRADGIL